MGHCYGLAAAPINVGVSQGQSTSLTFATGNSSLYLNVTGSAASNPALLNSTVLKAVVDPLTGDAYLLLCGICPPDVDPPYPMAQCF